MIEIDTWALTRLASYRILDCIAIVPNAYFNEISGEYECKEGWTDDDCSEVIQCNPRCKTCYGLTDEDCNSCIDNAERVSDLHHAPRIAGLHKTIGTHCACKRDWIGEDCS